MTRLVDHIKKSPHRNRLEKHIEATIPTLLGSVLDIGSKNRRYDHLFVSPPVAIDIVENKEKRVAFGNVTDLHFPDGGFQGVVCLEVLEYVPESGRAISEIYRVLAPGGTLVLSVPFLFKAHGDKIRYTPLYLHELLFQFKIEKLEPIGGGMVAILTILWGKIKSIPFLPIRHTLMAILLPFLVLGNISNPHDEQYASGYFVIAKKKI